ncbi:MAG TPA: ATP-binding protein, partial [bacterium]|nr:ATP-binding protein [bacterium]
LLEATIGSRLTGAQADLLADTIGKDLQVRTTIIATDGAVVGDSELDTAQLAKAENHLERPEVQSALKTGFGRSERYSRTLKKQMLYMALPLAAESGSSRWIVRVAVPVADIASVEVNVQKIIVAAVMIALAASILLSVLISFFISKPLSEMAAVARQMARGDFSRRAYARTSDEIGDLAAALSYMADEIKATVGKVTGEQAKLEAVLSSMADGVMVTDEKGRIVLINPSLRRMLLVDEAPEGKTPIEVIRNAAVQEIVSRTLGGSGGTAAGEIQIVQPHERSLKVNGVSVTRAGKVRGTVLVFHDITELKRLERVRRDFVANVSHELRTPIANIRGYAETLMSGALEDKEHAKDFLSVIYQESGRLARLIEDILDLSKIESGAMTLACSAIPVDAPLRRACVIVENQARQKSIVLRTEIPEGLPQVKADEMRLSQVFVNLLDNAIKFTPEGGTVTVSAVHDGAFIRIDVIDTGIGIPEKDLPRVFERFYRVDKAHARDLGGTGLGLSIVKHIVTIHGGDIRVSSMPGRGSTFSFTIPLA